MTQTPSDTEIVVQRAGRGDPAAGQQLLLHFQDRLTRMVAVRLDRRLAARVDPADIVQNSLLDAPQQRLSKLNRHHLGTRRRSALREQAWDLPLPDQSTLVLAERLLASGTSPGRQLWRSELKERMQAVLSRLSPNDCDVLILRYLEQLSTADVAAALGITEAAVKKRQLRALERLREIWGDNHDGEGQS
jgi:RNA polymerase sigma-70 factor (ECF subfamily)